MKLKPKIKVEYNRENGLNSDNEENSTQLNIQQKMIKS